MLSFFASSHGYIMGGYGKKVSVFSEDLKDDILNLAVRHVKNNEKSHVRIGYVPLHKCSPRTDYTKEGQAQASAFKELRDRGYDIIAMPTIDDFAEMFINEGNDERFYSSKSAQYKPHQQKWLMAALLAWVLNQNVDMALCLGWNCPNPRILEAELVAQSDLVIQLLRMAQQHTQ